MLVFAFWLTPWPESSMSKAVCVCEQKAQLQHNSRAMQQSATQDYDSLLTWNADMTRGSTVKTADANNRQITKHHKGLMSYPAFSAKLEETKKAFFLCSTQTGGAGANRVWEDTRVNR